MGAEMSSEPLYVIHSHLTPPSPRQTAIRSSTRTIRIRSAGSPVYLDAKRFTDEIVDHIVCSETSFAEQAVAHKINGPATIDRRWHFQLDWQSAEVVFSALRLFRFNWPIHSLVAPAAPSAHFAAADYFPPAGRLL